VLLYVSPQQTALETKTSAGGLWQWLAALILFGGVGLLAVGPRAHEADAPAPSAPSLWGDRAPGCPEREPDRARALAIEKRHLAIAKRERRPFRPREGVVAVTLFEETGACFGVARDAASGAEATKVASALRRTIEEEYHAHQVRLEHARAIGDMGATSREVRALLELTDGRGGPFVEWLGAIGRQADLRLATASKDGTGAP
jgi:hypothetical protein